MENENQENQGDLEQVGNDQNAQENTENTENTNESNEAESFDPAAFSSTPEVEKKPIEGENAKADKSDDESDSSKEDSDDGDFNWASYDEDNESQDEDSTNKDESNQNEDSTNEISDDNKVQDNDDSNEGNQNQEQSSLNVDDAYKAVAEKLGLEAESIDDLKTTLEEIQKENDELRKNQGGGAVNDTIAKLKSFKDKTDEDLVKLELQKLGFSEEEVQNAVDGYVDNNTLWIEAKKIRNTIDGAIKNEENNMVKSEQQAQATQEESRVKAVKSLTEHINNTDEMFGFKMAKDEAMLQKVRQGHTKYITSGDFLADVTKDNKNLTEAAWLWKNKDVILKAIGSREFNKGKKAIMDDISNPDVSDKSRFKDPGGSDSFDPKAFTYGS